MLASTPSAAVSAMSAPQLIQEPIQCCSKVSLSCQKRRHDSYQRKQKSKEDINPEYWIKNEKYCDDYNKGNGVLQVPDTRH